MLTKAEHLGRGQNYMYKYMFAIALLSVVTGCSRAVEDRALAPVNLAGAAVEPSNLLGVEVEGAEKEAVLGEPIPLDITIRNTSGRLLWIDEMYLPWTYPLSLEVRVDSPYLTTAVACTGFREGGWRRLEPGARLHGRVDLKGRLFVGERPSKTETVPVSLVMAVMVDGSDPGSRGLRFIDLPVGRLMVRVAPSVSKG